MNYESMELILVDDGSTDGSSELCDSYSKGKNWVKVIHKKNGGLSSARNAGMRIATGEFICFIDSDDYVKKNYLKELKSALEKNESADFSFCDFFDDSRPEIKKEITAECELNILLKDHYSREYVMGVVAWNKLFRKSFLEGIYFKENRWHEDEFFVNELLKRKAKGVFVNKKLYVYRLNEQSITGVENHFNLRHLDVLDAYMERIGDLKCAKERDLELVTIKNGFEKLNRLRKEATDNKNSNGIFLNECKRKYRKLYEISWREINIKQKIKYLIEYYR